MNPRRLLRVLCLALCAALTAVAVGAATGDFPEHRVTILTSFPPGGGTDFLARVVSQKLNEKWQQAVTVENRPGGNGVVGARVALMAPADGYTLYMGSFNHMVILPSVYENLPFDPVKDFTPIIPVGNQYFVLLVNPSVPAKNLAELVALAKSKPGEINYASPGTGVIEDLAGRFLQSKTGIRIESIPYKGSADALTALVGNQVSMMFASIASATPYIRSGRLRALAITAPQRSAALPEVPTAAEAGLSDFVMYSWNGLFAPKGTPKSVVDRINADVAGLLQAPDVQEHFKTLGVEGMGGTADEFTKLLRSDLDHWGKVVRDSGTPKQKI